MNFNPFTHSDQDIYLMQFNQEAAQKYIEKVYWESYIPSLSEFVAIPNTSRLYDPEWYTNGLLEKAGTHVQKWVEGLGIKGLKTEFMKLEGFSPLLFIEVEGEVKDRTILYYGHFDKQPHMGGWDADKGPTTPVTQNNCLYGRGVGDDGYSAYSSMLAVKAVQEQGIPLPRIVMIMQGDQESGNHIETYFKHLRERLGKVDIVYCFDSGAHNYETLWITKSIRGYIDFQVKINTLKEGVHSGDASGIVASTYRIASLLLNRLENLETGKVHSYFEVDIPAERYQDAYNLVKEFGNDFYDQTPKVEGLKFVSDNPLDLALNASWRPQMTVIGLNGLPKVECAGNVMLPQLTFKVNMRVPPTYNNQGAFEFIRDLLTKDTPFGCSVEVNNFDVGNGWSCRKYEPWFENVINEASKNKFGKPSMSMLEGGSVPIISILTNEYKESQIVVTGILGPNTNAHGPNEHLDLTYTLNFTIAMADILAGTALHYWSEKV